MEKSNRNIVESKLKKLEEQLKNQTVKNWTEKLYNCGDFPSPTKAVSIDLLAIAQSHSIITERKILSSPYSIGTGLGEVLMQRELLHRSGMVF